MTALPRPAYGPGRLSRSARFLLNGAIGTLLCTGPVTSVIALGWLMRRSGHLARSRFGAAEEAPGWLLGPREANTRPTSRLARALGGLGANIRSGVLGLTALFAWTLPFSLLWLGAWWAGWENSFNKGYEQAAVGPAVFLLGAFLAALILPALPLMLSHVATEDRLAAAFDLRRLRSVVAQSGWRVPALSLLTAFFALPFVAVRGLITTAPDWAPWIADLSADQLASLRGQITLTLAALAFLTTWSSAVAGRPNLCAGSHSRGRQASGSLGRDRGRRRCRTRTPRLGHLDHALLCHRHGNYPWSGVPDPLGPVPGPCLVALELSPGTDPALGGLTAADRPVLQARVTTAP